jgi:hypothetical protein
MFPVRLFLCAIALLGTVSSVSAQECQPRSAGFADAGVRREDAIAYVSAINAAQARVQKQEGRYAPLEKLSGLPSIPVGFIPKLLFDQWSYMLSLKDFFDTCGRILFSDERGIVYDGYPHTPATQTSDRSMEVPSQGEGSDANHR